MIRVFLLVTDIIIIVAAFVLSLVIRFHGVWGVIQNQTGSMGFMVLTTPILFYFNDLYVHYLYTQPLRVLSRITRAWLISLLLYIILGFITKFSIQIESRTFIILFYLLAFVLFVLIRIFLTGKIFSLWFRADCNKRVCRYIGPPELYARFADFFFKNPAAGLVLLDPVESKKQVASDTFLFVAEEEYENCYNKIKKNIFVNTALHVASPVFKKLNLGWQWCTIDDVPVYTYKMKKSYDSYNFVKRIVDIVGSIIALIILSPLFAVISLVIKVDSSGPIIYRQKRCGRNGSIFTFYKFRSMHENVGENVKFNNGQFYDSVVKKADKMDTKHITKFGNLLRKSSIDEWPQLFNVLKGEMSLVGPRPHQQYEVDCYRTWHQDRLGVMQGLTGVWQIYGRGELPSDKSIFLDLTYVMNRSLMLDIKLLFQTIPAVILGKGAY